MLPLFKSIMTSLSPILPTRITKFTTLLNPNTNQLKPDSMCAVIERRLVDCFEAYGKGTRGKEKCSNLFYDYHECTRETFQSFRYLAIQRERMKQYRQGKIDKPFDEHPPIDGMIWY